MQLKVFSVIPVNISEPCSWERRGKSVFKANCMLGSSVVTRGSCLRWLWFVKWALAKAGRDLHPSARSQKSHQNNNCNLLLSWPCAERGGRCRARLAGRCQPPRSRSHGLCGLWWLLPGCSHTRSCQEHVPCLALQLVLLPASYSSS